MADLNEANAMRKQPNATTDKHKPNIPRPKNKIITQIPKPIKKSTTETPLDNDPLWKESFSIDSIGETGFGNEFGAKEFEADAVGYIQLVESEYNAISDVDKYYAKSVSQSAHTYYHVVLYWYEIALIAQKNGTASLAQNRLLQFVQGYDSAQMAFGAGQYLEGLGDFTDATGVKHRLHATEPNDQGHFGRITHATHGLYETLPAPAIALQRVAADVAISQRGADRDPEWMIAGLTPVIPRADSPQRRADAAETAERAAQRQADEEGEENPYEDGGTDEEEATPEPPSEPLPTVNLLGWRHATVLNANQLINLRNLIDEDAPRDGLVNQRYSIRRELFELVEQKLRECKRYKLSVIPATTGGSIVQQVIWRPLESTTSRHQQAISTIGMAISRTVLPLRLAIAAKVMCYRMLRCELDEEEGNNINCWACYSYAGYTATPANWIANRNTLIQRGFDGLIDYAPFNTQITTRNNTLLAYLNKFKTY